MTSDRTSLRWQLRHATAPAHARLDALVGDALTDRRHYVVYLRGMHRFMVEAAGALHGWLSLESATAALASDLGDTGARPLAARRRPPLPDHAQALGWHYVIAGSALGARLLARRAATLGFGPAHGARFLNAHAHGRDWPDFLAALQARPLPVDEQPAALAAAVDAFHAAEAALQDACALQPA